MIGHYRDATHSGGQAPLHRPIRLGAWSWSWAWATVVLGVMAFMVLDVRNGTHKIKWYGGRLCWPLP